tara:strand:+ start:12938 stop:13339 length:402 start_codon:yes stop_codon:yes gene_type:complete
MKEVLLIDDNSIDQVYQKAFTEALGMSCTVASHVDEAVSLLKGIHFDLVLLDYRLPEIDGLQLLIGFNSIPNVNEIPIVVITGHLDLDLERMFKFFGAKAVLEKPLSEGLHGELIKYLIEQKEELWKSKNAYS